jgi:hypothetical protein
LLIPQKRRKRVGSVDDTTDAIQAAACVRFVRSRYSVSVFMVG